MTIIPDTLSENTNISAETIAADRKRFLALVLPPDKDGERFFFSTDPGNNDWRDHEVPNHEQLRVQYKLAEKKRQNVYFALARFGAIGGRKVEYSTALKAFFFDLDVAKPKSPSYKTFADANADVDRVLAEQKLPEPIRICSGHGLHLYWFLPEEIPVEVWRPVAAEFKKWLGTTGLIFDKSVPADAAQVLRLPHGTRIDVKGLGEPDAPTYIMSWGDGPVTLEQFKKMIGYRGASGNAPATDSEPRGDKKVENAEWAWLDSPPEHIRARMADVIERMQAQALNYELGDGDDWDGDFDELKSALWAISPDDQSVWSAVAFNLYPLGDVGLDLFLAWSQECDTASLWDRDAAVKKWNDKASTWKSEDGTGRVKAIFTRARERGWVYNPDIITDPSFFGADPEAKERPQAEYPEPYPGFMARMVDAAVKNAQRPQPNLTLLAVLTGMATACDGKFSLPDGGRLNLYALGVANSGEGKDAPRKAAVEVAYGINAKVIGSAASGQGLEDALGDNTATFLPIDEIGHELQAIAHKHAQGHTIEMAKNLLKLYSASGSIYQTREKAVDGKGRRMSRTLHNPCLSVLGFTTPSALSKALTVDSVESGLLGRFLFAVGDEGVRQRLILKRHGLDDATMKVVSTINRDAGTADRPIEFSDELVPELEALLDRIREGEAATSDPIERALLVRTFEKVMRVAGVLAVWDSIEFRKEDAPIGEEDVPPAVIMGREHIEWAERFVMASNAALLGFCQDELHDDEIQANAARVVKVVSGIVSGKYKPEDLRQGDLVKRKLAARRLCLKQTRMNSQQFDIAVRHAVEAGRIIEGVEKTPNERPIKWLALDSGE